MAFDYSDIPAGQAMQLRLISKRIKQLLPTIVPVIVEVGTHLEKAKIMLPHGRFGAYCEEEMGISSKSAQNYMNLARLARSYDLADLAKLKPGAAYELAAKNTPDIVVSEILADLRDGHVIAEEHVKARKAAAKDPVRANDPDTPPVDQISTLLIDALDRDGIREVELFLRRAKKDGIKCLCADLQTHLRTVITSPTNLLPSNSLS